MTNYFEVHAGWKEKPERIGNCYIEKARGNELISFSYDELWLAANPGFVLDPDIVAMAGRQYPKDNKVCFGFLSDTAPDRWGRKLMLRREAIDAREEKRQKRTLMESDFILGVNDIGRTGAIRFFDPETKAYYSSRSSLPTPPIEKIRELENSAISIEDGDSSEAIWIKNLIDPGSSLGGARPKANVIDERGTLWIAKFPSKNDSIDIGAWEMTVHELAMKCGLNVPEARVMKLSAYGSTYLSKRFDRDKNRRIHFASAMTMLGQTDDSDEDISYVDIATVIENISIHSGDDLKELWNRMVFNILISNTDDHLRNHGFLMDGQGWRLSPGYDINPSIDKSELSLSILNSHEKNLDEAVEAAVFFRVTEREARIKVDEMKKIVAKNWRSEANRFGIPKSEQDRMEDAFLP